MFDVRALSDRLEIDDLLTTYTMAVDVGDWDVLDRVFTADAHIDYTAPGGPAGPYHELKAWLAETLAAFPRMQHLVGQRQVTLEGDEAHVRAYFINVLQMDLEDGSLWHMDAGGVYVHDLVRTAEGWRSRRLVEEILWVRKPA